MLPLWLLLPLVDGVSQNVSDYCKEMHARRPQRANVILALRGESFRNGAGQANLLVRQVEKAAEKIACVWASMMAKMTRSKAPRNRDESTWRQSAATAAGS